MSAMRQPSLRIARHRPKDRKAQIARASADAFSALGFHAVSMGDIADRVGISAAALYRHSPSKYQLFRDAVLALGQQLVDCTEFVEQIPADADPLVVRDKLIAALIDTAIANRSSGGLYRWEGRFLQGDDQVALMDQVRLVNRRLQGPLRRLRPELNARDRWTLSSAALGVIGSIADHRAPLGSVEIRSVLATLATAVLTAKLPDLVQTTDLAEEAVDAHAAGRYEALLRESLLLFHHRGYRQTSMEDIARAVGMPASGIYRYFASKADVLAASFRRAADRVSGDVSRALAAEPDPARALTLLVSSYVGRSFDSPELAYLYYAERANLPTSDEMMLRNIQRSTVESWVKLTVSVRPELSLDEARFVVHAAFAVVVDLGRLANYDNTENSRSGVRALMTATLFAGARQFT